MTTFEARAQGTNPDGRSGGNGTGNLPIPKYEAPKGFEPKIIKSTGVGIEIYPATQPVIENPGTEPSAPWTPPETNLH